MQLTPDNCQVLGDGLDHPESVCLAPDGSLYAGGEAGQVYCLAPDGTQRVLGSTGGFLLGVALDGHGCIHACDVGNQALYRVCPDGTVTLRANSVAGRPLVNPNHGVFDAQGNFYMSDSGDYWNRDPGNGVLLKIDPDNNVELFHQGPFSFANGVALHPSGQWLYVAQSTAGNIVRVPFDQPNGPIEVTHTLPAGTVPDGLVFAADERVVIACYKPDAVLYGWPDGSVTTCCHDPTGELLSRPTNVAIGNSRLYISNLGGWHITSIESELEPAVIYRPRLYE